MISFDITLKSDLLKDVLTIVNDSTLIKIFIGIERRPDFVDVM